MKENTNTSDNYFKLCKFGLIMSFFGLLSNLLMFPSGIYYGFFAGTLGISAGILSRPGMPRKSSCNISVFVGVIDLIISFIAFNGLIALYAMLKDPVQGPQLQAAILELLSQYGLTAEAFVSILH